MHQNLPVMVPRFFNRGNALRPVNRIKHVIDQQGGLTAGTGTNVVLIDTVDDPVLTNRAECQTGSKVNGIFLTVEVTRVGTTSDVIANVYIAVNKNPGQGITFAEANAIGSSAFKKYTIHQEMIMLQGTNAGNPRTLFKGVIKIPRGYIRNGPLDRLQFRIFAGAVAINWCMQAHYKEFR